MEGTCRVLLWWRFESRWAEVLSADLKFEELFRESSGVFRLWDVDVYLAHLHWRKSM